METVLSAFIVIFIVLFGALTLSHATLSSQTVMQASWQEMQTRLDSQARTSFSLISARLLEDGTEVELTLRNDGTANLTDFQQWDAIVQYEDVATHPHIFWLDYKSDTLDVREWTVEGFYLDAAQQLPEVFEPHMLNPGEEAVFQFQINPAVAPGATLAALVSSQNGVSASTFVTRNMPPVLATNNVLTVTVGSSAVIGSDLLASTDSDDSADQLSYTVTTAPAQGALSLPESFTQADIDAGHLSYTQSGSGPDSFEFTISDGDDSIGPFTFNIAINQPPMLQINAGLAATSGSAAAITSAMLQTDDLDNLPSELTYTITTAPMQGTLSLPDTLTQEQIDDGLLSYNPFGGATGADSFEFTISDGLSTLGPYVFNITVN